MSAKSLVVISGLVSVSVLGMAPRSAAQTPSQTPVERAGQATAPARRVVHPRIEVNPRPLLYRRCTDWYVLQHRPSGTVLFPQQHCWWVRG
jgi:hypothetical protein